MKRNRGRPKGKKYPQPDDLLTGLTIATYGKIGASEAMRLILVCLHADFVDIETRPPKRCAREGQPRRWMAQVNHWKREVATVVWQRILVCDHEFFRQVAEALEQIFTRDQPQQGLSPRFLALLCKWYC